MKKIWSKLKNKQFSSQMYLILFIFTISTLLFQNCAPSPFKSESENLSDTSSNHSKSPPENLNATCGIAHIEYLADEEKFHGELCRSGVASLENRSFPSPGGTLVYKCILPNESVSCFVQRRQITSIPVDGECGLAQGQYPYYETQFRSPQFCQAGTLQLSPQFPTNGGENLYTCMGANGGSSKTCKVSRDSAPAKTPIHGQCGAGAGGYAMNESTFRSPLCSEGTASPSLPSYPAAGNYVDYSCVGVNNGATINCRASRSSACEPPNYFISDPNNKLSCGRCSSVQFYQADSMKCINRSFPVLSTATMNLATNLIFTPIYAGSEGWDYFAKSSGTSSGANGRTIHRITAIEGDEYELTSVSYFDPTNLIIFDLNGNAISENEEFDDPPEKILNDGGRYGSDKTPSWRAPYSGIFYVDTGWQQGSRFNYVELTIQARKK